MPCRRSMEAKAGSQVDRIDRLAVEVARMTMLQGRLLEILDKASKVGLQVVLRS